MPCFQAVHGYKKRNDKIHATDFFVLKYTTRNDSFCKNQHYE